MMRQIWKTGKIGFFMILITGSIGFVEKKNYEKTCISIEVNIRNQYENYFISESDVIDIVTDGGDRRIIGEPIATLNLKKIETDLYQNKFIRNAEVYKDLTGRLMINIDQSRPIARLMSDRGSDRYISNQGEVLPLSKHYTARVLLIDGAYANNTKLSDLNANQHDKNILELLKYIEKDKFWKAQIAQLNIDKSGNIKMYTQVSRQVVEFGKAEEIEEKFKKLKIFYKEILPAKGWNHYNTVNVKYKNQIVCE